MKDGVIKRGSKWAAVIELPRTADGRRKKRWLSGFATRKEAAAARARELSNLERGIDLDPGKLTVGELLTRWLENVQRSVGTRTHERYKSIVTHHLIPTLGAIPLSKLRALHIESAIGKWTTGARHDRKKGTLSSRSVAHNLDTLKNALRQAVKWDLIARNPVDAVNPPKLERRETSIVGAEGFAALAAFAQGTELEAPIVVALGTGLRRGELLGLRWTDVDLDDARLTVQRSLERVNGIIREKETKTARSRRTLPLPKFVVRALRQHRLAQKQRLLALGVGNLGPGGYVFDAGDGSPRNPGAFSLAFYRLMRRSKLPLIRFHDLRHSYGSLGLASGTDLKTISASLGHSTIATTANIYLHVVDSLQREAADRMDVILGGSAGANRKSATIRRDLQPRGCNRVAICPPCPGVIRKKPVVTSFFRRRLGSANGS